MCLNCTRLAGLLGTPAMVYCEMAELVEASALCAMTWKRTYLPVRADKVAVCSRRDGLLLIELASISVAMGSLSPLPESRMSWKLMIGQPPLSIGASQDKVMVVDVLETRAGAPGADGATHACTERMSLSSDSPL